MVDLAGSCVANAANSGFLRVEIHLSSNPPDQIIQLINALAALVTAVDSPKKIGTIHNATVGINAGAAVQSSANVQLRLLPAGEIETGKWSPGTGLLVLLFVATLAYYVIGTIDSTVDLIEKLQPHIQETKINGKVVPIEQAKKAIKDSPGHPLSGD